VDGFEFDLANMFFGDLSEECRDAILGYRFTIYVLEDAADEEVEEAFARLNASTPLTLIQKSRTEMGTALAGWTKEVSQYPFFTQAVSLTLAQARRECGLETLLQGMLLLDARDEGYGYSAISMSGVMKYCRHIRNNYSGSRKDAVQKTVEYLSEAFTEKHKFLKKSNVPMVFVMADMALRRGIGAGEFRRFIDCFSENVSPAYEENMGSGNIKRAKTEGRLLAIHDSMEAYFHITDGYPVYVDMGDAGNVCGKGKISAGNAGGKGKAISGNGGSDNEETFEGNAGNEKKEVSAENVDSKGKDPAGNVGGKGKAISGNGGSDKEKTSIENAECMEDVSAENAAAGKRLSAEDGGSEKDAETSQPQEGERK